MKRRRFVQALLTTPVVSSALAQSPPAGVVAVAAPAESLDTAVLTFATADDAADAITTFFDERQFATLQRLSEVLTPKIDNAPSAIDAGAPEFLDFLIGQSPHERQQLYQIGLDSLEYLSQVRFNRPFSGTNGGQADALLAPLRQPWNYQAPDKLTEFLRQAKADVRQATRNSRAWSLAVGRPNVGRYWLAVE